MHFQFLTLVTVALLGSSAYAGKHLPRRSVLYGPSSATATAAVPSSSASSTSNSSTYDYSSTGTYSVTPHDMYSSSVGVLGCKIDYNRVAYWPLSVDCEHMCVKLTYQGQSLNLLHVDTSGGAHDISYDAWNQLVCGVSATEKACTGGGYDMQYEWVDMSECSSILTSGTGKLGFAAANSMDQISYCLDLKNAGDDNWTADNYELYNIDNPTCTLGYDELCTLDYPAENQPSCTHTLGAQPTLTTDHVLNIMYPDEGAGIVGGSEVVAT